MKVRNIDYILTTGDEICEAFGMKADELEDTEICELLDKVIDEWLWMKWEEQKRNEYFDEAMNRVPCLD